ncbi:MAG: M14 family metallopeptidase [Acidobacteriota bacterium]|nr:M14 family metallopeptidase [Acidobacteriota bacterium]
MKKAAAFLLSLFLCSVSVAQKAKPTAPANADWRTPAEISDYRTTPRYDETMTYLRRIAAAAPRQVKITTFGRTGEGRDLVAVIVSRDGVFDPAALHQANRPIVLIQNAIHAGEMDGKDSCLALLREMVVTKTQARLLDRAVVIILPIYNADGHERFGPYNRINQNGPEAMGWRTQALNLNLNRDYMKADAPETRALLKLFQTWLPDFFVDDHVTDGADYQYDTTYAIDDGPDVDPALSQWIREQLKPYIEKSVSATGHVIGEYVGVGESNPRSGLTVGQDTPRFSTGLMILENRPGFLVEMHMLKDYKTRVTGNYELLRALLEVINRDADALLLMNRQADTATTLAGLRYDAAAQFPLRLQATEASVPFHFLGYKRVVELSEVSGVPYTRFTHEPENLDIPLHNQLKATVTVAPPRAYIVPAQWTSVIDVLNAHGLRMLRTAAPWSAEVETYRCSARWSERPYEGRHVLAGGTEFAPGSGTLPLTCESVRETMAFPAGSAVIPLDQRAAKVAIHWLEPQSPDSAMAWGFFAAIFEQKEYGESYVLEQLARDRMAKDPKLKEEFQQKLASDKEFAADPQARLNFFFRRSPWWDPHQGLYPVGRLGSLEGVPLPK